MRGRLGDRVRLQHILDAIIELENYLASADYSVFVSNSMMKFASIKQLEIIGEASDHLTDELKAMHTEIAWTQIKALRNIFVHEYFGIDTKVVWDIITNDLPGLKEKVSQVLVRLPE